MTIYTLFFEKKTVEDFKSPKSKLNILINKVHQRLLAGLVTAIKENNIIDKNLLEFIDFCSDNTPDFFYKITVKELQNQLYQTHQIPVDNFVSYAKKS